MDGGGECVQIVSIGDDDNNDFQLNEKELSNVIKLIPSDIRVSVVSVVGAFRTGKSFLLNFFLRYLKDGNIDDMTADWMFKSGDKINNNTNTTNSNGNGFSWMGGQERHTTGIWMWSKPFYRKDPDGSGNDIAILLLDTQGMFDNETTMSLTAQIFGISTMVSSFQIYNVDKRIQEDNLQHLALFAEYGRIGIKDDDNNNNNKSDNSDNNNNMNESLTGVLNSKPFQRLQFLVRDWQNFDWDFKVDDPDDKQDACYQLLKEKVDEYLNEVISTRGVTELQATRDQIRRCFESVDCFLLPHPGLEITKKTYDGSIENIDKFFRGMINKYVREIFDNKSGSLAPKTIHGRELTAPELLGYFKSYVNMFQQSSSSNSGNKINFPEAKTILEATTAANNINATLLAEAKFRRIIEGNGNNYLKTKELNDLFLAAEFAAMETFYEIAKFGAPEAIAIAKNELVEKLQEEKKRVSTINSLRNPFKNLEYYILPVVIAMLSRALAVILDWLCPSNSTTCDYLEHNLRMLSFFLFIGILLYLWRYMRQTISHFAPVLAQTGITLNTNGNNKSGISMKGTKVD